MITAGLSIGDFISEAHLSGVVFFAPPLLLAAMGELIFERSGILNLSIEGQMTLAASVAFVVPFLLDAPAGVEVALGLAAAAAAAVFVGLTLAYMSAISGSDQITVGLALLILSLGLGAFIFDDAVGVSTVTPLIDSQDPVAVPLLSDIPLVGSALFDQPVFAYVAILLVVPVAYMLFKTPLGRRLRAVGENPKTIDSLGYSVPRLRIGAAAAGSVLIGLGGAYLPMVVVGSWQTTIVGGTGWLALMLVILSRWRAVPILFGAIFLVYLDQLSVTLPQKTDVVPQQVFKMLPFILAIVVVIRVYGRSQAPAALTRHYDREARH